MKDQLVLRVVAKLLAPFILLFGLYIQLHGENSPGGGFQAGVVVASTFILYGIIFGLPAAQKVFSLRAALRGAALGLLLYTGVGVATLVKGGELLNYSALSHHPVHGQHWGIWLIELGVLITVSSVMVLVYYLFGGHGRQPGHEDTKS